VISLAEGRTRPAQIADLGALIAAIPTAPATAIDIDDFIANDLRLGWNFIRTS
jgi:hypothetical protein